LKLKSEFYIPPRRHIAAVNVRSSGNQVSARP
jgi:hypothetical protein